MGTGHELVGRMWLSARLSFLVERDKKNPTTARRHLVSETVKLRPNRWGGHGCTGTDGLNELTGEVV